MDTDYLTCGQCLKEFPLQQITLFIQHKKLDCEEDSGNHFEETDLKCYYCPRGFMTAWGLLVHVQLTHSMRIFVEKTSLSITAQTNQKYGNTQHTETPRLKVSPKEVSEESKSLTMKNRQSVLDNINGEFSMSQAIVGQTPENRDSINNLDKSKILSLNHMTDNHEINIPIKCFDSPNLPKGNTFSYSHSDVSKTSLVVENHPVSNYTNTNLRNEPLTTVYSSLTKQLTQTSALQSASNSNIDTNLFAKEGLMQHGERIQKSSSLVEKSETVLASTERMQIDTEAKFQDESAPNKNTATNNEQLHQSSDDTEEGDLSDCCDNQKCGVTIIPGSHQGLQECCNAVVPKKRKRHMELKHMPFSWSSSRYARRRMLQRSLTLASKSSTVIHGEPPATGTKTIFIDVEPDTFTENNKKPLNSDNKTDMTDSLTDNSSSETKDIQSVPVTMLPPPDSDSKTKSLILQPGAIFSIPFSYSLPSSISGTSTSIPISIVQAQLSGKQTGATAVMNKTSVSVKPQTDGKGQNQVSRLQPDEAEDSPGELIIADTDDRRRKYPTSKPFKCDKCPMAFNQRIHLKKHMSKHTGIKPYKCGECDYSTVERSHLKVHIRIHTGEKPFKCTYCEYATAQNSTLKIHLKRHHGGKMFSCHDCDKTFTQIEHLEGHQSEHISGSGGMSVIKKKSPGIDTKQGTSADERHSPGKDSSSYNARNAGTRSMGNDAVNNNAEKERTGANQVDSGKNGS